MALYSLLRRASSSLVPPIMRAVGSPRSFRGSVSTICRVQDRRLHGRSFFQSPRSFSTTTEAVANRPSSDESLLRIIDSEIKYVEENEDHDCIAIPDNFPFTIQDNPGERTILLITRNYQGEVIKVLVDMPNPEMEADEEDDDDGQNGDGDKENEEQSRIPLVVSVSKGSGLSLEFGITAFPDKISIDSLSIKNPEISEDHIAYEGPDFLDLDENLQKAFLKYLEIRGIKPSTTNIVLKYMINKDHKEYLQWLKNLRSFLKM